MKFVDWIVTENKGLQRFKKPSSEMQTTSANENGEGILERSGTPHYNRTLPA